MASRQSARPRRYGPLLLGGIYGIEFLVPYAARFNPLRTFR